MPLECRAQLAMRIQRVHAADPERKAWKMQMKLRALCVINKEVGEDARLNKVAPLTVQQRNAAKLRLFRRKHQRVQMQGQRRGKNEKKSSALALHFSNGHKHLQHSGVGEFWARVHVESCSYTSHLRRREIRGDGKSEKAEISSGDLVRFVDFYGITV